MHQEEHVCVKEPKPFALTSMLLEQKQGFDIPVHASVSDLHRHVPRLLNLGAVFGKTWIDI